MAYDPVLQDFVDERIAEALKNRVLSLDNLPVPQLAIKVGQLLLPLQPDDLPNGLWSPGDLKMIAGATPDPGWIKCDGTAISRTTYVRLFNKIGTLYGVGDGSTTFNIPNFHSGERAPVGSGGTHGLGAAFGASASNMPSHSHGGATGGADRSLDHLHALPVGPFVAGFGAPALGGAQSGSVWSGGMDHSIDHLHGIAAEGGGSGTDGNYQPSLAVTFCIYSGV